MKGVENPPRVIKYKINKISKRKGEQNYGNKLDISSGNKGNFSR